MLDIRRKILALGALALSLACWVLPSAAQVRVEVSGVGATQLPIAIPAFRGDSNAIRMAAMIQADLERSGRFKGVSVGGTDMDDATPPNLSIWRQANVDALVGGSVMRMADGRYDLRFKLWDVVKGQPIGGDNYVVSSNDLRLSAHRIADYIYSRLIGERSDFSSRFAYVTRTAGRFNLWLADGDGDGAVSVLASPQAIMSPAWSPDGSRLAYVSFAGNKPAIYVFDLSSNQHYRVVDYKGSNSAPAWSPDGRTLVATLSVQGGSQLFALNTATWGSARRLTNSDSINTEATFAPDGRIYFVSDRGGLPQIYRMGLNGGEPQRVTYSGEHNTSPSVSADGRWLAYISRSGGGYRLHVMDLRSGSVNAITGTHADEHPSFSPNGKMIMYATVENGRETLMITSVDGQYKTRVTAARGDIRAPAWGALIK